MHTVTRTTDSEPPPDHATPYFRARAARFDRLVARFATELGLPPDP